MSTPWQDEVTGRSDYADRHSGQRDSSLNVAFSGVKTGDKYVVGQSYMMNGDRYVANTDGTFQNMRTGRMLDGSSGASGATFFVKADATSSRGGEGASSGHVLTSNGSATGAASSGPGNGAAAAATVVPTVGPGAEAAVTAPKASGGRGPGTGVILTGPAKTTDVFVGGRPMPKDAGWSDASDAEDRYGEGDLLSPTWFYQWGVTIADGVQGVRDWASGNGQYAPTSAVMEKVGLPPADAIGIVQTLTTNANKWAEEGRARVTAPIPAQEPVKWY